MGKTEPTLYTGDAAMGMRCLNEEGLILSPLRMDPRMEGGMMRLWLAAAVVFVVACQGQAGQKETPGKDAPKAEAPGESAKPAEEKLYTVSSTPDSFEGGAENTILVQLKPVAGYKWNLEYPTAFKVEAVSGLSTDKPAYSVAEGSITASEAGADMPVKVKAEKGTEGLTLVGNFSLCQEDRCKLFRNEKIVVPVTVK